MADVFISYSRVDQSFVKVLNQALNQSQYDAWVDWEDIPLTADWWKEIQAGIDAANTFIFVISPDSVLSKVCRQEIDYATANHKRLMPIVYRDGFTSKSVHPALGKHNWLFFRDTDDFATAFRALVTALDTDLDHVKFHTRLLVKAREWETKGKTEDYLLRGQDLNDSETWLAQARDKSPVPTTLQQEFVYRSRQAETERLQQTRRRLTIFGSSVSVLALLALAAAGVAVQQSQRALTQGKTAFANQLVVEAQSSSSAEDLSQKTTRVKTGNTNLAFGLDRLPQPLGSTLAQELLHQNNPTYGQRNPTQTQNTLNQDKDNSKNSLNQIAFSPSDTFAAVITNDLSLRGWDLASQRQVLDWGSDSQVVDVGFSPDETLVAVATRNGMFHLWMANPQTGIFEKNPTKITAHDAELTDTAFSPDGTLLATASKDGTFKVWSIAYILDDFRRQVAHFRSSQPVQSIAFAPDGRHLVTGGEDGTTRVFSLDERREILCIQHDAPVQFVGFNADNTQMGSVSGMTTVRLWPWPQLLREPTKFEGVTETCTE
jgi:hypothetical protein